MLFEHSLRVHMLYSNETNLNIIVGNSLNLHLNRYSSFSTKRVGKTLVYQIKFPANFRDVEKAGILNVPDSQARCTTLPVNYFVCNTLYRTAHVLHSNRV